jgi:hypothetical protein
VPPLLNANAVIQCGHGGKFPVLPRGARPIVGGASGLNVQDFPGVIAAGCVFNIAGAPAPCVIVSVVAGMCPTIMLGGAPAVNQMLVCATTNGVPSISVASAGQVTVQGT